MPHPMNPLITSADIHCDVTEDAFDTGDVFDDEQTGDFYDSLTTNVYDPFHSEDGGGFDDAA